jgi:pimeloyl-ACP methyl ester carboxylesterase
MPTAHNAGCSIHYEAFGTPADPTLLLVNGLGSQCINYHEDWCAMFVAAGFHVVRFDNRDVGLSSWFDDHPPDPGNPAYHLGDMARDAIAVLDALEVERAHVMGLSMGGMIVQRLAISHRHRLLTMTSAMSRTGEPEFGQSTPEALATLTAPPAVDRASAIDRHVDGQRIWGSPGHADEARWRRDAERAFDRAFHPAGTVRQFIAVAAAGSWADDLPGVTTPTLVIHGDRDTLIDQSGGRRTAELIPGARFELIEGMGHDYPPGLWGRWVGLVAAHAHTAPAA